MNEYMQSQCEFVPKNLIKKLGNDIESRFDSVLSVIIPLSRSSQKGNGIIQDNAVRVFNLLVNTYFESAVELVRTLLIRLESVLNAIPAKNVIVLPHQFWVKFDPVPSCRLLLVDVLLLRNKFPF